MTCPSALPSPPFLPRRISSPYPLLISCLLAPPSPHPRPDAPSHTRSCGRVGSRWSRRLHARWSSRPRATRGITTSWARIWEAVARAGRQRHTTCGRCQRMRSSSARTCSGASSSTGSAGRRRCSSMRFSMRSCVSPRARARSWRDQMRFDVAGLTSWVPPAASSSTPAEAQARPPRHRRAPRRRRRPRRWPGARSRVRRRRWSGTIRCRSTCK